MGSACTKHSRSHSPETIYTVPKPNPSAGWFRKTSSQSSGSSLPSSSLAGSQESELSAIHTDLQKTSKKSSSSKVKGKKSSLFGFFKTKQKREEALTEENSDDEYEESTTEHSIYDEQPSEATENEASDSTLVGKYEPEEDLKTLPDQSIGGGDDTTKTNVPELLDMEEPVSQESREFRQNQEEESLCRGFGDDTTKTDVPDLLDMEELVCTKNDVPDLLDMEQPVSQESPEFKRNLEESLVEQTLQATASQEPVFDEVSDEEDVSYLSGSEASNLTGVVSQVRVKQADGLFSTLNNQNNTNDWRTHILNVQIIHEGRGLSSDQKDWLGQQVEMLVNVLLSREDVPKNLVGENRPLQRKNVKAEDERFDDVANPEKGRMKSESKIGKHERKFQRVKPTKRQNSPTPRVMRRQKENNRMHLLKSDSEIASDDSLELGESDPLCLRQRDRRGRRSARSNYGGDIEEFNEKIYQRKTKSPELSSSVNTFYTVQEDITDATKPQFRGLHGRDRCGKRLRDGLLEQRHTMPADSSPYVFTPVKMRDLSRYVCQDKQLMPACPDCFQQNPPAFSRSPSLFAKELRERVDSTISSSSESIKEVRKLPAAAVIDVQEHPPKMADCPSFSSSCAEMSYPSRSPHNGHHRKCMTANTQKMREQAQQEKKGWNWQSPAKIISSQHARSTRSPEGSHLSKQEMKMERQRKRQPRKSPTVLNEGFTTPSQRNQTTGIIGSPRTITNVVQQKQDMIAPKSMYLNEGRIVDNVIPQQKYLPRSRSYERQSPALSSTAKVKISPSVNLSDVTKDTMRRHQRKQKSDSGRHSLLQEVGNVSTKIPENVVPVRRTPIIGKTQTPRNISIHTSRVSTPKSTDLSTSTDQRHFISKPELQIPIRRQPAGDHASSFHESSPGLSFDFTSATVPVDNGFKKKSAHSPKMKSPLREKGKSPTRMKRKSFSLKRSPDEPCQPDATQVTPPHTVKRQTRVKFKDIPSEAADYERRSEQHQMPNEASFTPLYNAPDQFVGNSRSNQQSVHSISNFPTGGQSFSSPAQALAFSQFPGAQNPNFFHQGPMPQSTVFPTNMFQFSNDGQGQQRGVSMYSGNQQQQRYVSPLISPSRIGVQGMYLPNAPVTPNVYGNQHLGYTQLPTSNLQMGFYPPMQQQPDSTRVNQNQQQEAVSVAMSHGLNMAQTTTAPTTSQFRTRVSSSSSSCLAQQEKAKSDDKLWSESEEKKRLLKLKKLAASENSLNTTPQKPRKWRQCVKERDEGNAWWMPKDWAKQRGIGTYGNEWEFDKDKQEKELQIAKDANIEQIRMSRFISW